MDTAQYYLGIDGGGTKTDAVIVDQTGQPVGRGKSHGSNIHQLPLDAALEHIRLATKAAIADVLKSHPQPTAISFTSTCIGLAGLDTPADFKVFTDYFESQPSLHWPLQTKKLILTNDGLIGLVNGTDQPWGICLVSSTGSNCYGVNQNGQTATAGGWGHLLGDQGSCFAIGLKLLRLVLKETDGRRPRSILTDKVVAFLGCQSVADLTPLVYRGHLPVSTIASLAKLCADTDLAANEDIQKVVRSCSQELILAYQAVIKTLSLTDSTFPVVLIGGMFTYSQTVLDQVTHMIHTLTPQATITHPKESPAIGAAKLARQENLQEIYPKSIVKIITP